MRALVLLQPEIWFSFSIDYKAVVKRDIVNDFLKCLCYLNYFLMLFFEALDMIYTFEKGLRILNVSLSY